MESTVSQPWSPALFRAAAWRWFAESRAIELWPWDPETRPEDLWSQPPKKKLAALFALNPKRSTHRRKFCKEHIVGWGYEERLEKIGSTDLKNARDLLHLVVDALSSGFYGDEWGKIAEAAKVIRNDQRSLNMRRTKVVTLIKKFRKYFPLEGVVQCVRCLGWFSGGTCESCPDVAGNPSKEEAIALEQAGWEWSALARLAAVDAGFRRVPEGMLVYLMRLDRSAPVIAAELCIHADVFGDGWKKGAKDRRVLIKHFDVLARAARKKRKRLNPEPEPKPRGSTES